MNAVVPSRRDILVLDEIPLGCVAYRVDDNRCEPVIKRGDIIAVDTRDRMPVPDEPYLIEWSGGKRSVVAAYFTQAPEGSAWHGRLFVGDLHPRQLATLSGQPVGQPTRWGGWPLHVRTTRREDGRPRGGRPAGRAPRAAAGYHPAPVDLGAHRMTEQCNRCRFWREDMTDRDPNDPNWGFGHCRLRPPVISETYVAALMPKPAYGRQDDPDIDTTTLVTASLFPATHSEDWCGSFEAAPVSPTAIEKAFADMREAYAGLNALPLNATDEECDAFNARIDAARDIIKETPGSSPSDMAIKLRTALTGINQGADEQLLLYRLSEAEGPVFEDWFEDLVYSTAVALESGQ